MLRSSSDNDLNDMNDLTVQRSHRRSLPDLQTSYYDDISVNNSVGVHFGSKIYHVHRNESSNAYIQNTEVRNINNTPQVNYNIEANRDSRDQSEKNKFQSFFSQIRKNNKIYCIIITIIFLIGIAVYFILAEQRKVDEKVEVEDLEVFGEDLQKRIVQRREWNARSPDWTDPLGIPVPKVIISHTETTICKTKVECIKSVQDIQNYHMDVKEWIDIGYNFLVGGDGSVFVGRGHSVGAHSGQQYNLESIGISLIGNFKIDVPTQTQLNGTRLLIDENYHQNKLTQTYQLLARSDLGNSDSPGKNLYDIIKTWPHFSKYPK